MVIQSITGSNAKTNPTTPQSQYGSGVIRPITNSNQPVLPRYVAPKQSVSAPETPQKTQLEFPQQQIKSVNDIVSTVKGLFTPKGGATQAIKAVESGVSSLLNGPIPQTIQNEVAKMKVGEKIVTAKAIQGNILDTLFVKPVREQVSAVKMIPDLVSAISSQFIANQQRAGGQNFDANPKATYTPQNNAQKLGVSALAFTNDLAQFYMNGGTGAGSPGDVGTQALKDILSSSAKVGSLLNFGERKIANLSNQLKNSPLTFQDISDVTNGRASAEKIAQYQSAQETGLIKEIIAAHRKTGGKPETTVYQFLRDMLSGLKQVKKTVPVSNTETKLLSDGITEGVAHFNPQQARNIVIGSDLEGTKVGNALIKASVEAEAQGKSIQLSLTTSESSTNGLTTPNGVVVKNIELVEPSTPVTATQPNSDVVTPQQPSQDTGVVSKEASITENSSPTQSTTAQSTTQPVVGTSSPPPITQTQQPIPQPTVLKPVGEGDLKTSKLASGVEQKAIENKLTKGIGDLPEYRQVNMKDQARLASELLAKEPDKALEIALGQSDPPNGILPESVFVAVENKANIEGNISLLRQLATSTRTTEATAMGQRIRALAERDPDSAVGAIKNVADARANAIEKKVGKTVDKHIKETTDKIKKEISKPKKHDWGAFIQSIKC